MRRKKVVERMGRSDCVCVWYAGVGGFLAGSRAIVTKKQLSMLERASNVQLDALNKHYVFVDKVFHNYISMVTVIQ